MNLSPATGRASNDLALDSSLPKTHFNYSDKASI